MLWGQGNHGSNEEKSRKLNAELHRNYVPFFKPCFVTKRLMFHRKHLVWLLKAFDVWFRDKLKYWYVNNTEINATCLIGPPPSSIIRAWVSGSFHGKLTTGCNYQFRDSGWAHPRKLKQASTTPKSLRWATVETQIKRLQMSDSILKSILALWLLKVLSTDSTTDSFFLRTLQIKSNLMQLKMISWWHTFHFPRSETEVASEVGRKAPHSSSEGHGNTVDCAH